MFRYHYPFLAPPAHQQSVAAVCVSGQNQQSSRAFLPFVNPIAIRNTRGNHFANVARPQLAFCCGVWVCVCVEGSLLAALVPTCSIFHSNLFSCACIFSLRAASAHPCISFWLARFVWFNYRLTAATLPTPPPPTHAAATATTVCTPLEPLTYDLLFKVYPPYPLPATNCSVIVAQLHGKVAKLNF